MEKNLKIKGNHSVIIRSVSDNSIVLQVDGQINRIHNRLDALQSLMEELRTKSFQTADKIYNIGSINKANFDFALGRVNFDQTLPEHIKRDMISDKEKWPESLRSDLLDQGVTVGRRNMQIFEHYGWLIATYFQKMQTKPGKDGGLRRLSFMAEAYQSSLRYLCYIQIAQLLYLDNPSQNDNITKFLTLTEHERHSFDYLNLLILSTDLLQSRQAVFVDELRNFVREISTPKSDLYRIALYLEKYRQKLIDGYLKEDDELIALLDEYLTALVYWSRQLAFLAKYRLVSIKEIGLLYRLGSAQQFRHIYGDLHGTYNHYETDEEDYNIQDLKGVFTYNQSILLLKGSNVEGALSQVSSTKSYLSLSPLIIDQSVFTDKPTQTPEIYYYTGYDDTERCYHFALYKNELAWYKQKSIPSNKEIIVKAQNNRQPKLNDLFKQLDQLLRRLM